MASFQGNLGTIRANVIDKLRLDATADEAKANEWINVAYLEAVQSTGALETVGNASLTDGDASYTLPAAVAQINLLTITYSDGTVSQALQRVPLEVILDNRRATLAEGDQLWLGLYALVGQNQIELWPTPGAGQTLTFWYTYLPDELSADADEPLLMEPYGSMLLQYGALVEGARFLKDFGALSDYEAGYAQWMARYQVWLNRRQGQTSQAFRVRGNWNTDAWTAALPRDVG